MSATQSLLGDCICTFCGAEANSIAIGLLCHSVPPSARLLVQLLRSSISLSSIVGTRVHHHVKTPQLSYQTLLQYY